MNADGDIGVVLCRCRGRLTQRLDLESLKNYLAGIKGVAFVDVEDNLCHDPGPLKKRRSKGLVIAGCSIRKHIAFLEDTLERAKIPLFLCEFVDLAGTPFDGWSSSEKAMEVARLIIKAHIEKLHAAFALEQRAKAAGIKEVMEARKGKVSRRGFLRLPLMAAKIISHYEEIPLFNEDRCIAGRSPCRECIRSCPYDALEFRKGKIRVLEDQCEKCGLCAILCPLDAVQMPTFSHSQALRLVDALADCDVQVDHRLLILTCDKGREKIPEVAEKFRDGPLNLITVRVPCVASLSTVLFLRCLELGFNRVISLCPDAACPKRKAVGTWKEQFESVSRVMEILGLTPSPASLTIDRNETGAALSQVFVQAVEDRGPGTLNPHPTEMSFHTREDMVRVLGALVQDKDLLNVSMEGLSLPFFDIEIDGDKCCFCSACVRLCPAGALKIDEDNGPRIGYAPYHCVGCAKCVEICPEGAVAIHRIMSLSNLKKGLFITKASDEPARCKKCGQVIGKKSLLEAVEKKLRRSGFEELAERVLYCQTCKNRVVQQG